MVFLRRALGVGEFREVGDATGGEASQRGEHHVDQSRNRIEQLHLVAEPQISFAQRIPPVPRAQCQSARPDASMD